MTIIQLCNQTENAVIITLQLPLALQRCPIRAWTSSSGKTTDAAGGSDILQVVVPRSNHTMTICIDFGQMLPVWVPSYALTFDIQNVHGNGKGVLAAYNPGWDTWQTIPYTMDHDLHVQSINVLVRDDSVWTGILRKYPKSRALLPKFVPVHFLTRIGFAPASCFCFLESKTATGQIYFSNVARLVLAQNGLSDFGELNKQDQAQITAQVVRFSCLNSKYRTDEWANGDELRNVNTSGFARGPGFTADDCDNFALEMQMQAIELRDIVTDDQMLQSMARILQGYNIVAASVSMKEESFPGCFPDLCAHMVTLFVPRGFWPALDTCAGGREEPPDPTLPFMLADGTVNVFPIIETSETLQNRAVKRKAREMDDWLCEIQYRKRAHYLEIESVVDEDNSYYKHILSLFVRGKGHYVICDGTSGSIGVGVSEFITGKKSTLILEQTDGVAPGDEILLEFNAAAPPYVAWTAGKEISPAAVKALRKLHNSCKGRICLLPDENDGDEDETSVCIDLYCGQKAVFIGKKD